MVFEYAVSIITLIIFAGVFILPFLHLLFSARQKRKASVPEGPGNTIPAEVRKEQVSPVRDEQPSGSLMDHIDDFYSGALSSSLTERYGGWDDVGGLAGSGEERRDTKPKSRIASLPNLKRAVVMAELLGPPLALRPEWEEPKKPPEELLPRR